ncbi:hypothetical protein PSN01_04086 [Micromonospora saelicesensis]|nr:hypothetical protein PSN01_04086 [Micromonospora saelicesensis]
MIGRADSFSYISRNSRAEESTPDGGATLALLEIVGSGRGPATDFSTAVGP